MVNKTFSIVVFVLFASCLFSCDAPVLEGSKAERNANVLKLSLAEWSLHKAIFSGEITNLDFPVVAKNNYGIEAVEYVSQFFADKAEDTVYLAELKSVCEKNGVKSLLIMIDGEGALADGDDSIRNAAVENHFKWVKAAKFLGCHSIRVNLHGAQDSTLWEKASVLSLTSLGEYAASYDINIIVENHGSFSSNGGMLAQVLAKVNRENCGTLPDFGNFCFRREKGDLWESPCVEYYDRYKGVKEMLPYAKGVSAKSLDFDSLGNETSIDYGKMIDLVKTSSYDGYIGIEYEGTRMSEEEGIRATKKLLEKVY